MPFPAVDLEAWRARVEAELAGESLEGALAAHTPEGLPVLPLYGPQHLPGLDLGVPGSSPFVRGGRPADGRRWRIAAEIAAPDPVAAAAEVRAALEAGADALYLRFDRCGRLGFAHHTASNTVGVDGVAVVDRADLAEVLASVDPSQVPVALDAGGNALPAAALFIAECRRREFTKDRLRGHLGVDVHSALARDGALPGDLEDARRELVELTVYSRMHFEHVRALAVDARPWHRAGGHAVHELGLALAGFVEALRWLQDELPPAAAAAELVFRVDLGRDLLNEVAKLRALRLLYAKVMSAASVPVPAAPVVHAFTSPRSLTARDPHTNLVRTTLSAFAGVIGGADWITTTPFDTIATEGVATPHSRRLALTTQHVLDAECHLGHVADPLGGAYYVEARTVELARAGFALMQDIERRGGLGRCIVDGYVDDLLTLGRAELESAIARRARPIIGVSEFPERDAATSASSRTAQLDAAAVARSAATSRAAKRAETRLRERGRMVLGDLDGFEHAVRAAQEGATLAELGGALVRGAPLERRVLANFREAKGFEDLRDIAGNAVTPPRVFLACLGALAEYTPRATFATQLFTAGGFEVEVGAGSGSDATPEVAARTLVEAWSQSEAPIVCICGSDRAYSTQALVCISALHAAGSAIHNASAAWIVYAGRPRHTQHEQELRDAGVEAFAYRGSDALALLRAALGAAGATAPTGSRAAAVTGTPDAPAAQTSTPS